MLEDMATTSSSTTAWKLAILTETRLEVAYIVSNVS